MWCRRSSAPDDGVVSVGPVTGPVSRCHGSGRHPCSIYVQLKHWLYQTAAGPLVSNRGEILPDEARAPNSVDIREPPGSDQRNDGRNRSRRDFSRPVRASGAGPQDKHLKECSPGPSWRGRLRPAAWGLARWRPATVSGRSSCGNRREPRKNSCIRVECLATLGHSVMPEFLPRSPPHRRGRLVGNARDVGEFMLRWRPGRSR